MTEYVLILVSTILVNNFVLVQFLGLCPFMGVSNKLETAMGMGLATAFVLTLSSVCAYLTDTYLLEPLGLTYLEEVGGTVGYRIRFEHRVSARTRIEVVTEG